MSKSVITVTAVVQRGGTPITLKVVDSSVTLDRGWEPYGQGSLTVVKPSVLADLQYIDPRNQPRIVITLTRTDNGVLHSTRTFNACVIRRRLQHGKRSRLMGLEFASDETLLQQYGLLSSSAERVYGLDVKTAVLYALNKIGRDAYLVTDPSIINRITNPGFEANLTNWAASGVTATRVSTEFHSGSWSAQVVAAALDNRYTTAIIAGAAASLNNYASFWIKGEAGKLARIVAFEYTVADALVGSTVGSDVVMTGAWQRLSVRRAHGATGTKFAVAAQNRTSGAHTFYVDDAMHTNGSLLYDYFDGSTTDTALFDYSWTGTAHASTSTAAPVQTATLSNQADLTVLTNLSTNPISPTANATTGWTVIPGGGTAAATIQNTLIGTIRKIVRVQWSAAATGAGGGVYKDEAVTAGKTYSFRMNYVSCTNNRLRIDLEWRTGGGVVVSTVNGPELEAGGLAYTDAFTIEGREAPATATIARVKIVAVAGTGYVNWPVLGTLNVGSLMVNEGTTVNRYFDGTGALNPVDAWPSNFVHAWTGTAEVSTSTRTPQPSNDAMVWTPNQSAWEWIAPIVKSAGLQLWCDEARNWHLLALTYGPPAADPASFTTLAITSGTNLNGGSDEISMRQDSSYATGLVAATTGTRLEFASGGGLLQYTPSTGTPTKVVSFPIGVYSPLGLEQLLTRAVSRGRVYDLDATPDYSASPAQALALTVPDEPVANVKVGAVTWKNAKRTADMAVATQ